MARRQTHVSVSEIETLRRQLGELASGENGLPDEIRQKFERLLMVAYDPARQDEAVRLTTEVHQFYEGLRPRTKRRRRSSGPVQVSVRLEPPLLTALDKYMEEQEAADSRGKAVRMILNDALAEYGLLPLEKPPPIKSDAN